MTEEKKGKRLVLYVPADRQSQVDEWRDRMNYSRLFFDAFDRKVALLKEIDRMSNGNMDDVVGRLKTSKANGESAAREKGTLFGVLWAKDSAEYSDLQKIAGTAIEFYPNSHDDLNADGLLSILEESYDALLDFDNKDDDPRTWTEDERHAWAIGFVEGATEIYIAVADRV